MLRFFGGSKGRGDPRAPLWHRRPWQSFLPSFPLEIPRFALTLTLTFLLVALSFRNGDAAEPAAPTIPAPTPNSAQPNPSAAAEHPPPSSPVVNRLLLRFVHLLLLDHRQHKRRQQRALPPPFDPLRPLARPAPRRAPSRRRLRPPPPRRRRPLPLPPLPPAPFTAPPN